ncbi:MAG: hypothetical protein ISS44_05370 [Candidatus Omnitrophica bacterium]|nr:hypothetical protein [Candidatus Omnitrophota bacterium]
MIKVDFSIAVSFYLLICLGFVFYLWLLFKKRMFFKEFLTLSPRFIWCCSICTYTYFTTHKTEISVCPRCSSYNKYSQSHRFSLTKEKGGDIRI